MRFLYIEKAPVRFNPLNPGGPYTNGRHFADNVFISIVVNEKFYILIRISPKFVPNVPIENNPVLV